MTLFVLQFFPNLLLIFCRITAFFVVAPFFSSKTVPVKFKVGVAAFMTLLTFSMIGMETPIAIDGAYVVSIIREILTGLALGYIALLFFSAAQVAGSFIDFQLGFSLANVIDPLTGVQAPLFGNFKYYIAILIFLAINGHHFLIQGIMNSYEFIPLSGNLFTALESGTISNFMIQSFSTMFEIAFQLSAPFVVVIFLLDLVLGVMAKTTPQLNIFVVGLPTKIFVGFIVFIALIPGMLYLFEGLFKEMFDSMYQLMKIIQSA